MADLLSLKQANCKNCHKCLQVCPVKAIRFTKNQANIIAQECILCGRCAIICPQKAKEVRDDLTKVKDAINSGRRVIAAVAPSFISAFAVSGIGQMQEILKALGFFAARESAEGACLVKCEYERMIRTHAQPVIISSGCPTVVSLIQKCHPKALTALAPVVSPMTASARQIKAEFPDAYVVFIGSCISKKEEIEKVSGTADCVLTFEELERWLAERKIKIEPAPIEEKTGRISRLFTKTGGVIESMDTLAGDYEYLAIDGIENCVKAIREIEKGDLAGYFIEMSACEGSCINGPAMSSCANSPLRSLSRVNRYAQPNRSVKTDFEISGHFDLTRSIPNEFIEKVQPSEEQLQEILAKMGKTHPEQELDCGSCGYPTCREKAWAVFVGKSDSAVCPSFLCEQAESFSDNVFNISPNAIIVLGEDLCIQRMNAPACHLFGVYSSKDLMGSSLEDLMDLVDFQNVRDSGNDIIDKRIYLPKRKKYVELSVILDSEHHKLFGIFKDITREYIEREKYKARRAKTIDITDKVLEKQMRIVQEIASLLGETTAETKIALNQIKNTVLSEDD